MSGEVELRALIAKATQEELCDGGRYFADSCDDLTRCRHEEIGEYQHSADGDLVEWLWNHRTEIADMYATRQQPEAGREGEAIPADIAAHVRKLGRVEWGQTPAHDAEGHGRHVADSVRITAANFGQTGDQQMHGLWLEGTETVLCHTGTSPNAPMTTQALVGAWNWLVDQVSASPAAVAGGGA